MYTWSEQLFSDGKAFFNLFESYFVANKCPSPKWESKNMATLMFPELIEKK